MRQILFLAVAALVAGGYLARFADKTVVAPHARRRRRYNRSNSRAQSSAGQHTMELSSGRDGHFHVDARIDGRHIDFLVDTGASLVVLRETDAAMIGIHPMRATTRRWSPPPTARSRPRRAKLERIEIGDITVFDVPALVLPDEALSQNLLGVAFLSRLRRYEVADGRLVLEQ